MISRLIDMNINTKQTNTKNLVTNTTSNFTIQDYAKSFIAGMHPEQRKRFKQMLDNGIQCGMSVAYNYGINYEDFIQEVKNELKVSV